MRSECRKVFRRTEDCRPPLIRKNLEPENWIPGWSTPSMYNYFYDKDCCWRRLWEQSSVETEGLWESQLSHSKRFFLKLPVLSSPSSCLAAACSPCLLWPTCCDGSFHTHIICLSDSQTFLLSKKFLRALLSHYNRTQDTKHGLYSKLP